MKVVLVALLFLSTVCQAEVLRLPYYHKTEKQILKENRDTVEQIAKTFQRAEKIKPDQSYIGNFNYENFDSSLSEIHPVLVYVLLRYLADNYSRSGEPVRLYLMESQVMPTLTEMMRMEPKWFRATQVYDRKAIRTLSLGEFLKILDELIVELQLVHC